MTHKKFSCIVVDDELISREIIQKFIERTDFLELKGGFTNAISAAEFLRSSEVDIMFLDVEMPEMTGLELIKTLNTRPKIILITVSEKYALDAFEYEVSDYLLKPVVYSRFLKAVTKISEAVLPAQEDTPGSNNIFLKVESRLVNVNLDEIDSVEAQGDYIQVCAGTKKYLVHSTLAAMEQKLSNPKFMRVHRSFIINIEKISSIEDNTLVVSAKVIPVGNVYKDELMKRLNIA